MKTVIALVLLVFIAAGCSENTTSYERKMELSPKTLVFGPSETQKTVSITHTCTCAFSWHCTTKDVSGALVLVASGSGDNTAVPIQIDRSKLTVDTLVTYVHVTSNYQPDSVLVTVYK
jgi:hypothetical protein